MPLDVTLPWAVIPVPAFAAAFWLASRYRPRLEGQPGQAGWRARLAVFLDAVLLIRALFTRPVRHRAAITGMALFWAGDALAIWAALAAFGQVMNGAALIVGYCTGMVVTRRIAPLAGAGTLALILPLAIWASGAPLATAITAVAACRLLGALSLPPAAGAGKPRRPAARQQPRDPRHRPTCQRRRLLTRPPPAQSATANDHKLLADDFAGALATGSRRATGGTVRRSS